MKMVTSNGSQNVSLYEIAAQTAVDDLARVIIDELQLDARDANFDGLLRSAMLERLPTIYDESLENDRIMLLLAQGLVRAGQVEALHMPAQMNTRTPALSPINLSNPEHHASESNANDESDLDGEKEALAANEADRDESEDLESDDGRSTSTESELPPEFPSVHALLSHYGNRQRWQEGYRISGRFYNVMTTHVLQSRIARYNQILAAVITRRAFIGTGDAQITEDMMENFAVWVDYVDNSGHRERYNSARDLLARQLNELNTYDQLWANFWDLVESDEPEDSHTMLSSLGDINEHRAVLNEIGALVLGATLAIMQIRPEPEWTVWGDGSQPGVNLPTRQVIENNPLLSTQPSSKQKKKKKRAPRKKKKKGLKKDDQAEVEADKKPPMSWTDMDDDEEWKSADETPTWKQKPGSVDQTQEDLASPNEPAEGTSADKTRTEVLEPGTKTKKKNKKRKSKAQKAKEAEEQRLADEWNEDLERIKEELDSKESKKANKKDKDESGPGDF